MLEDSQIVIGEEYVNNLVVALYGATQSVRIVVFDFRVPFGPSDGPVNEILEALKAAQVRGVEIKILTSNDFVKGQLKKHQLNARVVISKKLLHVKMVIIDNHFAFIGSHNWTLSAMTLNWELSVIVQFKEWTNKAVIFFDNLWDAAVI